MSLTAIQRQIEALMQQMDDAVGREDFEAAARLRDRIAEFKAPSVRKPPPGQMGLGTNIPVAAPPQGWKRPKKPDPMTSHWKKK